MSGSGVINCWSCGCARGEEAYGLRMLWCHRLGRYFSDVNLVVHGTDYHRENVEVAQLGSYTKKALEDLPPTWILRDFKRNKVSWGILRNLSLTVLGYPQKPVSNPHLDLSQP